MKFSTTEENYIKEIYHLQRANQKVSSTLLAAAVNTKAASVTDMLKKLHVKKLVHYRPYQNFTLTEKGNKVALTIVRKHRLWEYFLVSKLGFNWEEVHDIAEQLEHINSNELVARLDNFLGHPSFDPHGDPIPDKDGKIKVRKQKNLIEAPDNKAITVCLIKDQSTDMLDLLKHYHIAIGTKLKITNRFSFDNSIEIKIAKYPVAVLSEQVAKNIYCII